MPNRFYYYIYSGYYQNVRLTAVKLGKHRLRLRAVKLGSPGHIIKRFLRRKVRTANWSYGQQSYGELSVRRIVRTANCPYGEVSIRRTCLRRTCIRRTCLRRIVLEPSHTALNSAEGHVLAPLLT